MLFVNVIQLYANRLQILAKNRQELKCTLLQWDAITQFVYTRLKLLHKLAI